MTELQDSPTSIRLLDKCFRSEHYPKLFEGSETHDAARDLIASLVSYTDDEELLFDIVRSGLPTDYDGDTLDEIPDMVRGALKKGFDRSDRSSSTQSIASAVVELARPQIVELFHDENDRAFATISKNSGWQNLNLNSSAAGGWLSSIWYRSHGRALQEASRGTALATLAAQALYDGPLRQTAMRVARYDGSIYIDLGDDIASIVRIDANGWKLVTDPPVKFIRPPSYKPLPAPEAGGDLLELKSLLQISDQVWPLLLAFLISAFRPEGPYFCLLVDGEQGSGKSFLCSILKLIIDPSRIEKLPLPATDVELFVSAKDSHLLIFDNASRVGFDMSDALCRLATGGTVAKRKLYTDDDVHVIRQCKPFVINGIGDFADRPDLLERSILISLEGIEAGTRRTETELLAEFDRMLPSLLGKLCDILVCAIRNEPTTSTPANIRMADAARWLKAAEPATGLPPDTFIKAIEEAQAQSEIERARDRTLFRVLEKTVACRPFEGQIAELFDTIMLDNANLDKSFPRTAAHLSNELRRHRQVMAKAGLFVELLRRSRTGRRVKIWLASQSEPSLGSNAKKPPDK